MVDDKILAKYHTAMNDVFEAYGSFVARRPAIPLITGLLLLGGLCFGLFNVDKEADLEKLWVEQNSRVAKEKEYYDSRFGGVPRLEAVTITAYNATKDESNINLVHAMDGLKSAITPLYENLTMHKEIGGKFYTFRENDFCERPLVPDSLKPGTNPLVDGNFISWGYSRLLNCSIKNVASLYAFSSEGVGLPDGWGIDWLPCIKLSPLDCFREGGDFDYPLALKQLEHQVGPFTLVDYTALYSKDTHICQNQLRSNFTTLFEENKFQVEKSTIDQLVQETVEISQIFFTWGYRWRKSYANMTNKEVINHINSAVHRGKSADPNPANPQIISCITEKAPCCMTWFGLHSPTLTSLGSVEYDHLGNMTKIGGIRWAGNNYHQQHPVLKSYINSLLNTSTQSKEREALSKEWESVMINHLDPLRQREQFTLFGNSKVYGNLQLEFNMWRSSEDIISDANKTPVWQIILSIILTSVYAFAAFVNFKDPVHSHTWLALTGMAIVSLAVVAGFGFSGAIGIKLTPLAGSVVPFLALGLGIDDVFVLVSILRNYLEDPTLLVDHSTKVPDVEMRRTTALAGPSVVLTTFSVLASFFISSLSPMPIVRWFCWQMGITATVHTCGMLLIFLPVMSIDARRVKSRICDPYLWAVCGIRGRKKNEHEHQDLKHYQTGEHTGSSLISRAVAKYYAPLFESNLFKGAVVLLFAAFLAVTSYLGFAKVERGLLLSDVTLKGSYQNTFAVVTEDRFLSYQIVYVTRDTDFPKYQERLVRIYETLQHNLTRWLPLQPNIIEAAPLGSLMLFANTSSLPLHAVNFAGSQFNTVPVKNFYRVQHAWAGSPLGMLSIPDYYCKNVVTNEQMDCFGGSFSPNLSIGATKASIFAEHLGANTQANLDMIKQTRKLSDDINKEMGEDVGFMYGYPYLFYEQYLHSARDLYTVVGFALIGVFVAVLVFQFSFSISILIALILLMVDLEVYGFIYIIGAKLNSLSLVNLGIVIGMASEFTYLARSFLMVDGTKNYRIGKALEWTLEPLLHGFGTQVAATLPLLFLKYHAFRLYYFAMFTIMGIVGFLNGFILLPVLLSWFGPSALPHIKINNSLSSKLKNNLDNEVINEDESTIADTETASSMDLNDLGSTTPTSVSHLTLHH